MNKTEFKSCMDYLYSAYPNQPKISEIRVYYDILGIFTAEQVMGAIREWVSTEKFFPRVSQIRNLIQDKVITKDQVLADMQKIIAVPYGQGWSKELVHPISYKLQKELGGKMAISTMSSVELDKKVTMKYKYYVNDEIRGLEGEKRKKIGTRSGGMKSLGKMLELQKGE